MSIPARVACLALSLLAASLARADSLLPAEPVSLDSLAAFRPVTNNWRLAGGLGGDLRRGREYTALPGTGLVVSNPVEGGTNDQLFTAWEHGDMDLEVDFLVGPKVNSGIYLQGRYEVQIFDSAGVKDPTFADSGGIYQRWDPARGAGHEGFEGHAPKANASRAPGLWQHLEIQFRAPRFDAKGVKVANACFVKVVLNGYTVQENVEVTGPTRAAPYADEKPTGPVMFQSNHGPVAFRHLAVKRYGPGEIDVGQVRFRLFAGAERTLEGGLEGAPTREAGAVLFADALQRSDERGIAVFDGDLTVPTGGLYEFRTEVSGRAQLSIDGQPVVYPAVNSEQAGTVALAAGKHSFQLRFQHGGSQSFRSGGLKVWAAGPGLAPRKLQAVGESKPPAVGEGLAIPVTPTDRVLLQRTFVMLPKSRRMYACFVGSPVGVHYAYDFEQAAIIGVWRGGFFDGKNLWHERAEDQQARATGPGFQIEGRPLLFQFGDHDAFWPVQPPQPSESRGYRLEADGQPVFRYYFAGITVDDRIAARADGAGLERTLKFGGKSFGRETWALLAESGTITPQPDGGGYVIGDGEYYLDVPKDSPVRPTLRREGERLQLLVHVPESGVREFTYNLIW